MPKIIRIIGIIICVSVALWAARLCIVRATVSKSDLKIIEDKIVSKRISYTSIGRYKLSRDYHVEFKLENRQERIAINFPTKRQTYQDSTIYKIDTGKVYKFYLDKSYPTFLNKAFMPPYYLNAGVDIIENTAGDEIFSKSHKFEFGAGIFFIILAIGITFFTVKFGKWKNGS